MNKIEISKRVTKDLNEFVLQMLNTAAILHSGLWGEKQTQRSERAGHLEASCVHELILSLFIQAPEITESSSLWSQKESVNANFIVS